MKILTITYGYPPFHKGGYEIRCRDVMERLKQKGHEVLIVTTRHPSNRKAIKSEEPGIFRVMHHKFEPQSFVQRVINDIRDTRFLKRKIEEYKPDVIYLWQIATLSSMIIPFCAKLNIPLCHDVADDGLIFAMNAKRKGLYFDYKVNDPWLKNVIRKIVYNSIELISGNSLQSHWDWPEKMRVNFNSRNVMLDAERYGIPIVNSQVIYAGVDTQVFTFKERKSLGLPIRIFTPGRIVPRKGTIDLISLGKTLLDKGVPIKLTIVGSVGSIEYVNEINQKSKDFKVVDGVEVINMVGQNKIADLYHEADICFFPSHQKTGLSAVPLEAMACGCVVISYGNENSAEIIENGHNGFIIPEEDYEAAASLVQNLLDDQDRYGNIVTCARKEIEQKYTMDRYVDDLESFLLESIQSKENKA
jgi:glycosyltransferase involved in cell wall biosynthesis